ncbi:MAG: MBL fold metallo-hydrolase [Bacteroidales bacterium]|nr:MAG: MBL fold metallo-hydrolase [Bacteroidales bacterium]
MRLTVLTENTAGGKFLAEHGLSYLIERDDEKILFDTGHSDIFLKNGLDLGIDVQNDVKTVVLSHGHWDHGDGLQFLNGKTFIAHPSVFTKRYRKGGGDNIGLCLSKFELEEKFTVIETKTPFYLSEHIIFLGEIPRNNHFESQNTAFVDEQGEDDFIPDDSALAIIQNNELIVVTGCSHSGICNIVKYAQKVSGINKVKAIIGGFHLKKDDLQTKKTVEYLKQIGVDKLYPSHCTELPALAVFYNEFKIHQVKTGQILNF